MSNMLVADFDVNGYQRFNPNAAVNPLTPTQLLAAAQSAPYGGLPTVLFGDSMTSQLYVDTTPSATSYDTATGILTLTDSGHGLATGWNIDLFNRSYTSLKQLTRLPITRVDANNYTVQLSTSVNTDLPSGALTGTTYTRQPTRHSANSTFNWVNARLGHKLKVLFNGAQSGDTTQDCLDRIYKHCLNYNPALVYLQMPGINDMSISNGPSNEETIWTNQKAILTQLLAAGCKVICISMTPVASGESRGNLQTMSKVQRLTHRLAEYCRSLQGVVFINANRLIVNSTNTTGYATAGYLKSTDNIHYSVQGARRVAAAVYSAISSYFPGDLTTLPCSHVESAAGAAVTLTSVYRVNNVIYATSTTHNFYSGEYVKIYGGTSEVLSSWNYVTRIDANTISIPYTGTDGNITGTIKLTRNNNLFPNPVLATTSGGSLAGGATGTAGGNINAGALSGTATSVASVVAHPDGYGNVQRLVVSDATAGAQLGFQMTATSLIANDVVAGRTYEFEAYVKLASANWANTIVDRFMFRLIANVSGTLYSVFDLDTYDGLPATGAYISDTTENHHKTARMTLPSGVTALYWQVYAQCMTTWSATNLTIDLGQIAIREVIGE